MSYRISLRADELFNKVLFDVFLGNLEFILGHWVHGAEKGSLPAINSVL